MQRKFFPFVRGVRGGSSEWSWGNFVKSFLTFSRGKNEFFQSCSEWCQKLKKNRLYFSAFGGGGIKNPKCRIFVIFFIFLTLYPSLTTTTYYLLKFASRKLFKIFFPILWKICHIFIAVIKTIDKCIFPIDAAIKLSEHYVINSFVTE